METVAIAARSQEALNITEFGLQAIFAGFLTLWTFALGAVIGSFLNVVIYRLPRGMSLSHPKSRCPHCQTPIRARDNIPILSWLLLRGRCRSCRGTISARYPLIEAVVAIIVLGLAWVEIFSGGINFPGSPSQGFATNPLLWRWETATIVRCAYHAYLLIVAVAIGAIVWDGFRPPRSLVILSLFIGAAVPTLMPPVWPVNSEMPRLLPVIPLYPAWNIVFDANTLIISLAGLAGGLITGVILVLAKTAPFDRPGVLALSALAGIVLGWPAMTSYAPLAAVLSLLVALLNRRRARRLPMTVVCAAALIVFVFAWRFLWQGIALLSDCLAAVGLERELTPAVALLLALIIIVCTRLAIPTRPALPLANADRQTESNIF